MSDSHQLIGDVATGLTVGAGVMHLLNENAAAISVIIMLFSALIALIFHILSYIDSRKRAERLKIIESRFREGKPLPKI